MPSDTDRAAREAHVAVLRKLGPAERVRLAAQMSEDARAIAIEGERRRHPELTLADARRALMRRQWGDAIPTASGSSRG